MRRWGWLVAVPLTPVVVIGAALTLSIFGAFGGIPLLLLTARPWWACLSVGLGRKQPRTWSSSLRVHLAICLAASGAAYVGCAIYGLDDLDGVVDAAFWAAFTAMLLSALYGGTRLIRLR